MKLGAWVVPYTACCVSTTGEEGAAEGGLSARSFIYPISLPQAVEDEEAFQESKFVQA
jgi:hypothetical protein